MQLTLVRSEIVRAIEAEVAAQGLELSFTQCLILKRLARSGPMSASELARAVELDGGAMTRQLDHLQRKGYLTRQPHAQDRRALRIELTAEGQLAWQQLHCCNERVLTMAQRTLSHAEQQQLTDYLDRVLHALRDKS